MSGGSEQAPSSYDSSRKKEKLRRTVRMEVPRRESTSNGPLGGVGVSQDSTSGAIFRYRLRSGETLSVLCKVPLI
jgi:hypothetical protein